MKWIDRAEARFGHLAVPHLVQAIGVLSAVVFFFFKLDPNFFSVLELYPGRVMAGEVWRLVTYIFVPTTGSLLPSPDWVNVIFYMLFLFWIGNGLEQVWSPLRVNVYCLITMAGITVAAFFFGALFSHFMLVQALFFAFARYYPDEMITFPPVKVKWLAWFDVAWLSWMASTEGISFTMAMLATLTAYFLFFGREIFQGARFRQEVASRRQRFEASARDAGDEAMHHCAVCGRTELAAPDLDFRVASDGQEYCVEHLPKPARSAVSASSDKSDKPEKSNLSDKAD
jgi:hypothetical protein